MPSQRIRTAATLRRKTLATCLAAALAVGSANASAIGEPTEVGNMGAFTRTHSGVTTAAAGLPGALLAHAATRPARAFDRSHIAPKSTGAIQAVGNCNDSGAGSLREAVTAATDGDTIDLTALTCSTITLPSGAIEIKAKDLTLQGPGQDKLRVSGNHASQVFSSKNTPTTWRSRT